ncbi:YhgE/Pip domain-containing protein [Paenibacillus gansuensis]|uniref:YhgE/Pip domain-containing protein n=1 Tax=Paenibacillus gansuensis TaxID=306542 RepID=A0ABW5PKV2_9BACL
MKSALLAFLKKPTTKIGIMTAFMFQVIFSIVWMTGYDGVTGNMKHLKIAIVNEDRGMGAQLSEKLASSLPFEVVVPASLQEAQEKLYDRDVHMVLHIPAAFSQQVQAPDQQASLQYFINESNPAMIKSAMASAAAQITDTVNKQAAAAGTAAVLTQVKVPADQAGPLSAQLSERVVSQFNYSNQVTGMNSQMVPMMMVLASYVGAMIMGMNLQQSALALKGQLGKWSLYAVRCLINVVTAFLVSLVGSSLVIALGGQAEHGFLSMWLFQSLFVMVFMFVSQLFLILFGMAGMLFNMIMLSAQLVSSGALVPRDLLSGFYHQLSSFLPATYAVEGLMNILFGGPSSLHAASALLWIALVSIVVGAAAIALRKEASSTSAPEGKPSIA